MSDTYRIRPAVAGDAEAVARLYNHFVATCTATWQTEPDSADRRRMWLTGRKPQHPVFAAEDADGVLVAFAALSPYSERGAFAGTAEVTLYIADAAQGRGLGGELMRLLIAKAEEAGLHLLVSRISGDRVASIGLHRKYGFIESGRIPEMGRKFGRRLDLVYMHRFVAA